MIFLILLLVSGLLPTELSLLQQDSGSQSTQKNESDYSQSNLTSTGLAAQGLETLSLAFSDLNEDISEALANLDEELDSSIYINADIGTSLIEQQISELTYQLYDVLSSISDLEAANKQANEDCGLLSNCDECTQVSSCVWCLDYSTCIAGDQYGPSENTCKEFNYNSCDDCNKYKNCTDCLNSTECGWCNSNGICFEYQLSNNCINDYIRTSNLGFCPKTKGTLINKYQAQLYDDKNQAADLQYQILGFEADKKSIQDQADNTASSAPPEFNIQDDLEGLSDQVDNLYINEENEEQEYLDSLTDSMAEYSINSFEDMISKGSESIHDKLYNNTYEISGTIKELTISSGLEIDNLDDQVNQLMESLGINSTTQGSDDQSNSTST
jgi:Plexin repeat